MEGRSRRLDDVGRRLRQGRLRQPQRRLPLHPRRSSAHDPAGRGRRPERVVRRGPLRQLRPDELRRHEGGRHLLHADLGPRAREVRHSRERGRAGLRRDGDHQGDAREGHRGDGREDAPSAGWASPRTSRRRTSGSPPTRRRSSTARRSPSTAGWCSGREPFGPDRLDRLLPAGDRGVERRSPGALRRDRSGVRRQDGGRQRDQDALVRAARLGDVRPRRPRGAEGARRGGEDASGRRPHPPRHGLAGLRDARRRRSSSSTSSARRTPGRSTSAAPARRSRRASRRPRVSSRRTSRSGRSSRSGRT